MSSVDVIVPCYRYGRFLRGCVESVLSQSLPGIRVLIIDDASPDNTAEIAADLVLADARVSFVRHWENKGHIATYNEGIEWASADYMLLLSADDYILPDALRRATDLMDAHPEVGFIFGDVVELGEAEHKAPLVALGEGADGSGWRILTGTEFIELSGAYNPVGTCTAVVRTALQKRIGGYRPELPHAGDLEMWLRFAAHASVGFVTAYQGVYRRHAANMSTAFYYYAQDGRFVYAAGGRLGDLQQRKAAIDCFFQSCGGLLSDARRLQCKLDVQLANTAIARASAAFNEGRAEELRQLAEFALNISPQVRNSLGWIKLTCKRRIGLSAWRVLRPAVASIQRQRFDRA